MVLALNVLTAADDLAQAIASPPQGRPFQDAIGAAGRRACDSLGQVPPWALNIASNVPGLSALGAFPLVCQPYYDANGYDGPELNNRGSGGQCPGVLYDVTRFATNTSTGAPVVTVFNSRVGPITLNRAAEPEGGCPVFFNGWRLVDGNGNTFSSSGICSSDFAANWSYSAVRSDGLPDECGDQDPFLEPGANPPPDPGPYEPGEEPFLGPGGEPILPVPPVQPPGGFPPVEVPPPGGEPGEPGGGPSVNPENGPGDPEATGEPIGGEPGAGGEGEDVDFGDPPEGRAWVGCYVQLDVPEDYGDIPGSRPGNAVYPRVVGNVSLIHGGQRSQAVQLRSEWTDIFRASPAQPVDGARLNVLPSISYLVYPVSVPLCPESTCPPAEGEEPPAT